MNNSSDIHHGNPRRDDQRRRVLDERELRQRRRGGCVSRHDVLRLPITPRQEARINVGGTYLLIHRG